MLKRLVASMGVGAVVALALPTAATAQMTDRPEGKEMTISGTVIDLSCRFAFNVTGAEHRMCAQVCADAGVPLAILGDDGTLYLPVSSGMPGSSQNTQLKPHAEHKVTVKGMVFEAGAPLSRARDRAYLSPKFSQIHRLRPSEICSGRASKAPQPSWI